MPDVDGQPRLSVWRRVLCNLLGIPAMNAGRHLAEDQVLGMLKEDFREDVSHHNDYGGDSLIHAFWVGYQQAVEDSRSGR